MEYISLGKFSPTTLKSGFKALEIVGLSRDFEKYGIDKKWYGGKVNTIAILKDKPFVAVISKDNKTLAILVPIDDLDKLESGDLRELAVRFGIQKTTKMPKRVLLSEIQAVLKKSV